MESDSIFPSKVVDVSQTTAHRPPAVTTGSDLPVLITPSSALLPHSLKTVLLSETMAEVSRLTSELSEVVTPTPSLTSESSTVGNSSWTDSTTTPMSVQTLDWPVTALVNGSLSEGFVNGSPVIFSSTSNPSESSASLSIPPSETLKTTLFDSSLVVGSSSFVSDLILTSSPTSVYVPDRTSSTVKPSPTMSISPSLSTLIRSSPSFTVSSLPSPSPSLPEFPPSASATASPGATITPSASHNLTMSLPAADLPLGLVIALPVCAAVVILTVVVGILYVVHRRRQKGHHKAQRNDQELWMNTTLELPPLPPSPASLGNGHIVPLSETEPPDKELPGGYEVIHNFEAKLDSQLPLSMGQIISVFEKSDNGWWQGNHGNKTGWFPSEYVKTADKSEPETLAVSNLDGGHVEESRYLSHPVKPAVSSFLIRKKGHDERSPADLVRESRGEKPRKNPHGNGVIPNQTTHHISDENQQENRATEVDKDPKEAILNSIDPGSSVDSLRRTTTTEPAEDVAVSARYRVVYPYTAMREGELTVTENDVVAYLEEGTIGWVRGRKEATDEEGWVPASYLQLLNEDGMCPSASDYQSIQDQLTRNRHLSGGDEHFLGIEYVAMYPYRAQHTEDLTFEAGEVIIVLNALENGWWHGLKGETAGWFPGSYVELKSSGGSSPSSGIYDRGGNLLSVSDNGPTPSGSASVSRDSSQSDLIHSLSEAGDSVSVGSASTIGSEEARPKPVRKAPAPPGGQRSGRRKILRRPSRPAPPPPGPPGGVVRKDKSADQNNDVALETNSAKVSTECEDLNAPGRDKSGSPGEKPLPPTRFVKPKMVKIHKKKLKLENSNRLPSPPERPVPPKPPPSASGKVSMKNFRKKSSKKGKIGESKHRGSVNKLSKADISGPMTLETPSPRGSYSVPQVEVTPALTVPNETSSAQLAENDSCVNSELPTLNGPNSDSPEVLRKQNLRKTQSHLPPPVAPKPKSSSLSRRSLNTFSDHPTANGSREKIFYTASDHPFSNGESFHGEGSPQDSISTQPPVPKQRRVNSSEDELIQSTDMMDTQDDESATKIKRPKKKSLKKAVRNHTGINDQELSFEQGSFIKQMHEVPERPGWYMGMLADGTTGMFHKSHVEDPSLPQHSTA